MNTIESILKTNSKDLKHFHGPYVIKEYRLIGTK